MNIFDIKKGVIQGAKQDIIDGSIYHEDQRGAMPNPLRIADDVGEQVMEHIFSFPREVSHYGRSVSIEKFSI